MSDIKFTPEDVASLEESIKAKDLEAQRLRDALTLVSETASSSDGAEFRLVTIREQARVALEGAA